MMRYDNKTEAWLLSLATGCFGVAAYLHFQPGSYLQSKGLDSDHLEKAWVLLTCAGVVLFLAFLVSGIFKILGNRRPYNEKFKSLVEVSPIDDEVIQEIARIDAEAFTAESTDEAQMQLLYELNPRYLRCWKRKTDGRFAGFYLMSALSKATTEKILLAGIRRAASIPDKGFLRSYSRATAIYIHDVLGVEGDGLPLIRGEIAKALLREAYTICEDFPQVRFLFCRPVTKDGIRQAKKFGFEEIPYTTPGDVVWMTTSRIFCQKSLRMVAAFQRARGHIAAKSKL